MPFPSQQAGWPLGQAADDAVAFIEQRVPVVNVVSVMPNEAAAPGGDVVPVMDIGFTIPPERNIYYVHPLADASWPVKALHSITLKANVVLSIYQGLTKRADIIPLIAPLPSDY